MPICGTCGDYSIEFRRCDRNGLSCNVGNSGCNNYWSSKSVLTSTDQSVEYIQMEYKDGFVKPGLTPFENDLNEVLLGIKAFLMEKNKAYGDSALNPVRIFSKADPIEQIKVRIDDKLSRFARGTEFPGDNDEEDTCGYFVLLAIARLREGREKS